jgi:PTH1 family peptidyl-tRNA hydrolase
MNNSGVSVSKVMKNKNLDPKNIILMHDDLDLGPGDVRFKIDGGHGGHNGLKDIFIGHHQESSQELELDWPSRHEVRSE